jgi:phosphatidylglycerol:prolipoprotein diacylglycerol transferase
MTFGADGIYYGTSRIIAYYGLILMTAAISAAFLADFRARQRGMKAENVWDGFLWVLVGGILGARLWHIFTPQTSNLVIDPSTGNLANPYFVGGTIHILDILMIWKGGLGIPGAVIGGGLMLYFFTRRNGLSFGLWADIAAPTLAMAQAIGRWGNFVNQELYGAPSNLPWAITIAPEKRLAQFSEQSTYHPLFLYEMLWNLLNFGILLWLEKRFAGRLKHGDLFLAYLVIYPLGRFLLEFLRLDPSMVGGVNFNQTFMLVIVLASAVYLAFRHRSPIESKT